MSTPLLVDYFNQLPDHLIRRPGTWPTGMPDQGRSGGRPQAPPGGKARARAALDGFKQQVLERYNQGTLLRLLHSHTPAAAAPPPSPWGWSVHPRSAPTWRSACTTTTRTWPPWPATPCGPSGSAATARPTATSCSGW